MHLGPLGILAPKTWMRGQRAWQQTRLRSEGCLHCETTLRLDKDSVPAALHALRHSWRRTQFLDWLQSSSWHEAEELNQFFSVEELLPEFHQVSWKKVREALSWGPQYRAVLLGSVVSDAWNGVSRSTETPCSLCGHHTGHLRHLFWECPETEGTRPSEFVPPLQARWRLDFF